MYIYTRRKGGLKPPLARSLCLSIPEIPPQPLELKTETLEAQAPRNAYLAPAAQELQTLELKHLELQVVTMELKPLRAKARAL